MGLCQQPLVPLPLSKVVALGFLYKTNLNNSGIIKTLLKETPLHCKVVGGGGHNRRDRLEPTVPHKKQKVLLAQPEVAISQHLFSTVLQPNTPSLPQL